MSLINCEINLILILSPNCVVSECSREITFAIRDTKLYVTFVTLSTQDNKNLLKSGFRRTICWNKYQPKISTERQNQHLHCLIEPSSKGVNRLFFFLSENDAQRTGHT